MFPWGLKRWICSEKSALCIHANNSIWPMLSGILPLNRFYLSWARNSARLGSEYGPVGLRIVVRLDSGLVSLLGSRTQHEDSTRLDLTRCSARFAQDPDQLEARLGSLFWVQFTSARESGSTWSSLGLGKSAQCSAQLSSELGSGLSSGLSWGLAGG